MQCVVFYDGWQMQCCGTPFCIEDIVKWPVVDWGTNKLLIDIGVEIDYYYEAHSTTDENISILQGTVCQINALYTRYEPSERDSIFFIPISGFIRAVEKADGWDEDIDDIGFDSYIVLLKDISIQPAQETRHDPEEFARGTRKLKNR